MRPPKIGDRVLCSGGGGRIVDFDVDTGYVRYVINGVTVPVLFMELIWNDALKLWMRTS